MRIPDFDVLFVGCRVVECRAAVPGDLYIDGTQIPLGYAVFEKRGEVVPLDRHHDEETAYGKRQKDYTPVYTTTGFVHSHCVFSARIKHEPDPSPPKPDRKKVLREIASGEMFGDWTVIRLDESDRVGASRSHTYYLCKCKCGEQKSIRANALLTGKTSRCQICSAKGRKRLRDPLKEQKVGLVSEHIQYLQSILLERGDIEMQVEYRRKE